MNTPRTNMNNLIEAIRGDTGQRYVNSFKLNAEALAIITESRDAFTDEISKVVGNAIGSNGDLVISRLGLVNSVFENFTNIAIMESDIYGRMLNLETSDSKDGLNHLSQALEELARDREDYALVLGKIDGKNMIDFSKAVLNQNEPDASASANVCHFKDLNTVFAEALAEKNDAYLSGCISGYLAMAKVGTKLCEVYTSKATS